MGSIPIVSNKIKEIASTIKIVDLKKSFKLTTHFNNDTITFYIGGKDKYCIETQIFQTESLFGKIVGINIGHLSHIYYDANCSLEGGYLRKIDTKIIIRLMISFISKYFSYIKILKFNDTSYRECITKDGNIIIINLAELQYLLNGKTWYENNFNAYLDNTNREQFNKLDTQFQENKQKISWDIFKNFISTPLPFEEIEMKEIYNNIFLKSWQDFFSTIEKKIGITRFCEFISPWISIFMKSNMPFSFSGVQYLISLENNNKLELINFVIQPYIKGKGGYTRRIYKSKKYNSGIEL